ncbi:Transcription factor LRL3 [Cardamine amara subsp. amara]|uniref:Transcription factor LRL3 n=1 Tax=Cardamine amara subsp. amara TaxID=228776 RepID=A0ABD1BAU4_CARAN
MGFRSVYQSLTELFPQIDAKTLISIAMEHPNNADEAASVAISEIFPLSSPNFTQPKNKNKTSQNPPHLKVEPEMQTGNESISLSQWLQPSKLPQSYLALLNEEPLTQDVKPPQDYVVEKVVLPSRASSSLVKPSIRVQSCANNDFSGSSSKVPAVRRSSRKSTHPWSPDYSEKLRSWTKRNNNNNNNGDFSQLYGEDRDEPSKKSNKKKYKYCASERERKQRIDNNIKALGELLPHKVEENNTDSVLNDIVSHVKLLQLQMKELSRSRLGGEPISHPMTFIEGYGHYIHHEQTMTKSLEEVLEDLLTNDPNAAATLLESKGLYLMPLSSVQGFC